MVELFNFKILIKIFILEFLGKEEDAIITVKCSYKKKKNKSSGTYEIDEASLPVELRAYMTKVKILKNFENFSRS